MLSRHLSAIALSALAFGGFVGVAASPASAQPTVIIAPSAPPPPQVEVVPQLPTTQTQVMTWSGGHWAWVNGGWQWISGQYIQRPAPAAVWEPGHWETQGGGYVWIDGRWRSS